MANLQHQAMRSPLTWYGGKGQMVQHIVPLLPPHEVYVEAFAGGLAVLFAKQPSPLEIANDLDGDLVQFYRVLRDPALFGEFARLCALTPYSRAEWRCCRASWKGESDPLLRCWQWFITVRQGFNGNAAQGPGSGWRYSRTDPGSSAVSRYLSAVDALPAVHARLRSVQVELLDWRDVLVRYDGAQTLFYLDPPYIPSTRGCARYTHEMTLADHHALGTALLTVRGMVVLSGYRVAAVHGVLEEAGWQRRDFVVAVGSHRAARKLRRTESVWCNPRAVAARERQAGPLFAALLAERASPFA